MGHNGWPYFILKILQFIVAKGGSSTLTILSKLFEEVAKMGEVLCTTLNNKNKIGGIGYSLHFAGSN